MNIRRLSGADAPSFHALRLAALLDKPEAFASSHDEEAALPLEAVEERLTERPGHAVFGAFDAGGLAGIVGLGRERHAKTAHKAVIWGMYVTGDARGHGVARELVNAALAFALETPGIAKVTLCVDSANVPAIALYESLGFVVFAREHDAMRVGGQSRDDLQMHLRFDAPPPEVPSSRASAELAARA